MTQVKQDKPVDLGLYGRGSRSVGLTGADLIAFVVSLIWIIGSGVFFLVLGGEAEAPRDPLRIVMTLLEVFMPFSLIWVAATAAKSAKIMREESSRLQAAIDAMRHSYLAQNQQGGNVVKPSVEKKLDEIARAQKETETTLATFSSARPAMPAIAASVTSAAAAPDMQPRLALGTPAEELAPPIATEDFIQALNFPASAEDKDGFRALRLALQDRRAAQLVQASQDALTLLSQDGIYMDDLRPDRSRPEIWRRFAQGERGRTIAALGGIRDRSSLALSAGRMRKDPIFRDTSHHFLRTFDKTFAEFEKTASDYEIAKLADTRTARAFMLLGRVAGMFD